MKLVNFENIKTAMFLNKVSGRELAKELQISETSFYLKINGKRNFTANELGMIAMILKTQINFFYH